MEVSLNFSKGFNAHSQVGFRYFSIPDSHHEYSEYVMGKPNGMRLIDDPHPQEGIGGEDHEKTTPKKGVGDEDPG
ncbi:MAG: hypothetical protein JNM70_10330 [Anaerolineae bacterium]|nr:hypothetical protein [Anaerolineae bacterium]